MAGVEKRTIRWTMPLLIAVCLLSSNTQAKYGGGSGEPNDPYLIYTDEQMNAIGSEPNDWDKHFKLMADIDLKSYTRTDFNIIGYYISDGDNKPFTGVFDGNGKKISNFTYTSIAQNFVGLFSYVEGATIKDLGLIKPTILAGAGFMNGADSGAGSLAGYLEDSTISNCYAEGGSVRGVIAVGGLVGGLEYATLTDCFTLDMNVSGYGEVGGLAGGSMWSMIGMIIQCYSSGCVVFGETAIGGLVGENFRGSITSSYSSSIVNGDQSIGGLVGDNNVESCITNSYSTSRVNGNEEVGGLVGSNGSSIANSYSTGMVSGNRSVGGLVGIGDKEDVSNCFWDIQTSTIHESYGGTGLTTEEMQEIDTYRSAGWDFVGQEDGPNEIWAVPIGGGYPILRWQTSLPPELPAFSGGTGEPDNPYLISTADELNSIGHNPGLMAAHFKLTNDIDLTGIDFNIIGSEVVPFTGVFDGNGKKISNFTCIATEREFAGFFRYVDGATIKDLGLITPKVDGRSDWWTDLQFSYGSLIGHLKDGNISNCYAEGGSINASIWGDVVVGGLVGTNGGTIANCYSTVSVLGIYCAGGLVGINGGWIITSHSEGMVSGSSFVGGLVGYNRSDLEKYVRITTCYSTAKVTGDECVGGLVGWNNGDLIKSYSTGKVTGNDHVGGLVGGSNIGSVTSSFWDIETSGQNFSAGGIGKSTAEMKSVGTFLEAGWDFVDETDNGTEDIWWIDEGLDYPRLWWEMIPEN